MLYSELVEIYEKLSKTTKGLEKTSILAEFISKLKKEKNKEIFTPNSEYFDLNSLIEKL